jgi:hypothetical protein
MLSLTALALATTIAACSTPSSLGSPCLHPVLENDQAQNIAMRFAGLPFGVKYDWVFSVVRVNENEWVVTYNPPNAPIDSDKAVVVPVCGDPRFL